MSEAADLPNFGTPPAESKAPEIYADAFTIAWSPFGVDLTFGRNFEAGVGLHEPRVTVTMSPQLAEEIGNQIVHIAASRYEEEVQGQPPDSPPGPVDIGDLS